ncbi:MAG: hypothetical protein QOH10_2401 [Actinomycetota bacterium]|nr:hypothetical protein [Actinomycetota bacterium]
MVEFLAGVVAGIAAVGLFLIVLTPSRRVRTEARLDREVETRLLLGIDPDPAHDTATGTDVGAPVDDTQSAFGAAELQALRRLGSERSSSRRGSARRR